MKQADIPAKPSIQRAEKFFFQRRFAVQRLAGGGEVVINRPLYRRGEYIFLVPEVKVDALAGDLGGAGDIFHRGLFKAVPREYLQRGFEDISLPSRLFFIAHVFNTLLAADAQAAKDTLAYQQHELDRQKKLSAQGIASQAELDKVQHALAAAEQQVNATAQQQDNIRAALGDNPDIDVNVHPSVQQAQAALDRATLRLTYTVIKAPVDGIVTKVDQLQVGSYINAATPVFALVSGKDIWVEANFKETDLTHMRVGQDTVIDVDTYPGKKFHGKVVSLSPGTGSSFSLLPPENASGNWVKVVQRLPVRVSIENADPQMQLNAGLSVTATVDTQHTRLERGEY